ncbi:GNAT family N-acetyltransferase [Pleionea litopenaei]|uniref:GNAT family N-acetyltransferase n=1 Tax=Pleionea litopenaei TaxID=3070815 RepID=A0AA51X6L5_9GAMM|nr:GNAT family N-acetyltransferase [Pleionea sp. HL-JVS1]WMS86979.1 GNAT family N-acetyltransferase [Pleionea sp. HL-JVS1]
MLNQPQHQMKPAESTSELAAIETLAKHIWQQHYTPIIGQAQVDYMLDKFQSQQAMTQQIENEGYQYYSIYRQSTLVGYFAFRIDGNELFLSKLYVSDSERGQGLARQALTFMKSIAQEHGLPHITLTVNKYNDVALSAYTALGFENTGPVVADIGNGYIMDDYRLRLAL